MVGKRELIVEHGPHKGGILQAKGNIVGGIADINAKGIVNCAAINIVDCNINKSY